MMGGGSQATNSATKMRAAGVRGSTLSPPLVCLAACAGFAPLAAQAQSVTTSPTFFAYSSGTLGAEAFGINAGGTYVVGGPAVGGGFGLPFVWTSTGGFQTLTLPAGLLAVGQADSVSADGSVIVGWGELLNAGNTYSRAIVWKNGVPTILAPLAGNTQSNLGTVNSAGAIAVGLSQNGAIATATSWNVATGVATNLGTSTGLAFSVADAADDAGTLVVGAAGANGSSIHAETWTLSGGTITAANLGTLAGGSSSVAVAVNSDGTAITGWSHNSAGAQHAVVWNVTGGQIIDLGALSGATNSIGMGISADGSVVVGDGAYSGDFTGLGAMQAFRWTQATGMQNLNTLLSSAGVNMSGITLQTANGVSANGQFIVGRGVSASIGATPQAYIVRYVDPSAAVSAPTTPAPSSPAPSSPAPSSPAAPPIAGVTTPASLQTSIDRLGIERRTTMIQAHGFLDQMLEEGRRIVEPDYAAAYGTVGSLAGGAAGRANYGPVSLIMGLGAASESYDGASMSDAVLAAAKLRHVEMFNPHYGVFADVGGFWSPNGSYRFSRSYDNGAGTATGSGSAWGAQVYGFARAGVLMEATNDDEIASSLELGRQSLQTSAYQEPLSAGNPFEANVPGAFSGLDIFKARLQWAHAFSANFDAAIWGGWAHGFACACDAGAIIDGVGAISSQSPGSLDWAEYGLRVGYRFDSKITASLFLNGVAGPSVGSKAHVGGAVQMAF